jgi:branched-chain amino acid aminotransferase
MQYILHNDKLIIKTEILSVNNRAFRYGDGLFESMRLFQGSVPLLDFHLQRLKRGMKILGYKSNDLLKKQNLSALIDRLCAENNIGDSARIRLSVFRSDGGLYAPETDDCDFIMECASMSGNSFELNSKGLLIGIAKSVEREQNVLTQIKTTNSLINVLAAREAKENGWDDALLLNRKGNIAEATSSNLFIIKGDAIYTPPLEDGALDGIMRQQIARIIRKSNFRLQTKSLQPEELEEADEIFLTNAVRGIIYVVGYGKKRYYNRKIRRLLELLNREIFA